MSLIKANGAGDQDTGFYNGVATQSLKFDSGSVHKLTKDFSGTTRDNDKKMTISVWAKRGKLTTGTQMVILSNYTGDRWVGELAWDNDSDSITFDPGGLGGGTQNAYRVESSAQFRDPTSWYHIVLAYDSTQGTDTNRVKLYVNGTQQTLTAPTNHTFPAQNYAHQYAYAGANNEIGNYTSVASGPLDGYLSEFNFIDGLTLDPTSFGETKNGVWIAKTYTGSYGTNGYRLEFKGTGTSTSSGSVANPTNIGDDSSGNNNHWAVSGFNSYDCVPDSPENNWCTINQIDRRYGQTANIVGTVTIGNLLATTNSSSYQTHHIGTHTINEVASEGGVYFEFRIVTIDSPRLYVGLVATSSFANNSANAAGIASYSFPRKAMLQVGANYFVHTTNLVGASDDLRTGNTVFSAGEVGGMAILSDGKVFMHREGTYLKNAAGNTGNPSTGANPIMTLDLTNYKWQPYMGYAGSAVHFNFGQDPTFNGNETAPDPVKQDANSVGRFLYDVPTNCLALCSSNMVDPAIIESKKHFDVLLYTGTGNDNEDISGLNFQPDWVWKKSRTENVRNTLTDSSRGVGKDLFSDLDGQESNDTNGIKAFNSDGFRLGTSTNHNVLNKTYVAWCWKANGGTTTTNDASSTSIGNLDSVIQANTTAGFSIVTYTGQDAATTIAHGLGKKPAWIIVKQRTDNSTEWIVGHHELASDAFGSSKFLKLEENSAEFTNTAVFNATPTTTAIQLTTQTAANLTAASKDFVAYCFAEIDGFSKFGGYNARSGSGEGNDGEDGTFIFTGFRPAWIMIKYTGSGEWTIRDRARDPDNPTENVLRANSFGTEQTPYSIDFVANGFKCRQHSGYHDHPAGGDFVYMAFAEQPFKYANAR